MIDVAKVRDIFREQLRTYRPAPPLFHDGKDSFLADSVIEAIVEAVNEEHEKLSMKQDGYAANMIDLANRIAELEARPLWQLFHKDGKEYDRNELGMDDAVGSEDHRDEAVDKG